MKKTIAFISLVLYLIAPAYSQDAAWNYFTAADGFAGQLRAVHAHEGKVYAGGVFSTREGFELNGLAVYDIESRQWENLIDEMSGGMIWALEVLGSDLYVGGSFGTINEIESPGIIKYDLSTKTWSAVGTALYQEVRTLKVKGDSLIVGGNFSKVNGIEAKKVAIYNSSEDNWSALEPFQLEVSPGNVNDFEIVGDRVFIAGNFFADGKQSLVASYNLKTKTVSLIDEHDSGTTSGWGTSLEYVNGILYLGTQYHADNALLTYDIESGTKVDPEIDVDYQVSELYSVGDDLFIGGWFTKVNDESYTNLIRYNVKSKTIKRLGGAGVNPGDDVSSFTSIGNRLFLPGESGFRHLGITKYSLLNYNIEQDSWDQNGEGVNDFVDALAESDSVLFVGGNFHESASAFSPGLSKYDLRTKEWASLSFQMQGNVEDLLVDGDHLYVAGSFSSINNRDSLNGLARYTISSGEWSPVGEGLEGRVSALSLAEGYLIAGGLFSISEGAISNYIGAFNLDTQQWEPFPSNPMGWVLDVEILNGKIYAGGQFSKIGDEDIKYLGVYDLNSETWENVGNGVSSYVGNIEIIDNRLIIGGSFLKTGEESLNRLGLFDTQNSTWTNLGEGRDGIPSEIFIDNNIVYLGEIVNKDGIYVGRMSRYDLNTETWSPNVEEFNSAVNAFSIVENELFMGGSFTSVNGQDSHYLASTVAETSVPVSVDAENRSQVSDYKLLQNYPNPFNPSTVISYQLPVSGDVSLQVFDMLGRKVATLVDSKQAAGNYSVHFDGLKLSSGMYIYSLKAGGVTQTRKMMVIK